MSGAVKEAEHRASAKTGAVAPKVARSVDTRRARVQARPVPFSGRRVRNYIRQLSQATPMELVAVEREGIPGSFIKGLSKHMALSSTRMFDILGIPKATVEKKAAAGERVRGKGGMAAVGIVRLLGIAEDLVANSTAPQAQGFDTAAWLGRWLELPQPALGGRKPADLLDTPTGVNVVARLLGSLESGAYQ